jgi:RNA polymerase sigma-70 factor (ECF subfamily)
MEGFNSMLWIISDIKNEEDRTFVEEIYIRYEKQMYLIANHILNNHHDAEDCVHNTVRIIIDSLDKFKSAYKNQALDSLIVIACRNCAINMYNKKKSRNEYEASDIIRDKETNEYISIDIPDADADIEQLINSRERINFLYQMIASLDPVYRDALTLRIMDFSYEEIAKLLSVTKDTARQRVHRAREALKLKINEKKQ